MSSARPLVRHFSAFSFPWAAGAFTAPGAYDAKATREQRARHAQKQGGPVNADIDVPFMFRPLRLRSTLIKNRLFVSPMCQYSAQDGVMNDWHLVHLGQYAIGGAGMVITEATAVCPEGRITPHCAGLWSDVQIAPMKRIVEFLHAHTTVACIQLAHAGRKASTHAPFLTGQKQKVYCTQAENGWQAVGPSPIPWDSTWLTPRQLLVQDIADITNQWRESALRALQCNFDAIEIHAAHGYLFTSFLSPISNQRTDHFGGSLANRAKFLIDTIKAVRSVWPMDKPLLVRLSCTEWVDQLGGWNMNDTNQLLSLLSAPELGVDLIDCSSGGNHAQQQITNVPGYQVPFAHAARQHLESSQQSVSAPSVSDTTITYASGTHSNSTHSSSHTIAIGAVGAITNAQQAEQILRAGQADAILMARQFLRDPYFPLRAAKELGVVVGVPPQYMRAGL